MGEPRFVVAKPAQLIQTPSWLDRRILFSEKDFSKPAGHMKRSAPAPSPGSIVGKLHAHRTHELVKPLFELGVPTGRLFVQLDFQFGRGSAALSVDRIDVA